MRSEDFGVAPVWRATGDGAYTIPAGYRCIGIYVSTTAGNVTFASGGADVTMNMAKNQELSAHVSEFKATGTTAVGIYAALVKG